MRGSVSFAGSSSRNPKRGLKVRTGLTAGIPTAKLLQRADRLIARTARVIAACRAAAR